jgi:enoyl-[acyl-carrier protein] reductase I
VSDALELERRRDLRIELAVGAALAAARREPDEPALPHRRAHGGSHQSFAHAENIRRREPRRERRRARLRDAAFRAMTRPMLSIDLAGKHALVAGVADDGGFGWAIAKALAEAGATVAVATWPPALGIFKTMLERGKLDASMQLSGGRKLAFTKIYPLDAEFDRLEDVPAELRESRRYRDLGDFTIGGLAAAVAADGGVDIVVHSLANGPEVKNPLLQTSRKGYLGALSASAYSMVSMVRHLGPIARPGAAFVSLSYMASERVVPGYGGGMSSAKAALESDTRVLAFEAGRAWGHRINTISAGPFASRAASAIGFIGEMIDYAKRNAPLTEAITAEEVGATAAFLCSPLGAGITGTTIYVDKGLHAMGLAVDREGAAKPA